MKSLHFEFAFTGFVQVCEVIFLNIYCFVIDELDSFQATSSMNMLLVSYVCVTDNQATQPH